MSSKRIWIPLTLTLPVLVAITWAAGTNQPPALSSILGLAMGALLVMGVSEWQTLDLLKENQELADQLDELLDEANRVAIQEMAAMQIAAPLVDGKGKVRGVIIR